MTKDLSAEKIIEKLGGIRPLAKQLGLSASTVQGWKQRGAIPDARLKEIIKVAEDDNIDIFEVFEKKKTQDISPKPSPKKPNVKPNVKSNVKSNVIDKTINISTEAERRDRGDRREGKDRRQKRDPNFKGRDRRDGASRRGGLDRRLIQEKRRKKVVRQQKFAFVERTIMSVAMLYMLGTMAFLFLMGPEYNAAMQKTRQIDAMEFRLKSMGIQLSDLKKKQTKSGSFAGRINRRIEDLDRRTASIGKQFEAVGKLGGMAVQGRISNLENKVTTLSGLLSKIDALNNIGIDGSPVSITDLQKVISGLKSDVTRIDGEVSTARNENTVVAQIVQDVSKQDLGAAAMLLALGQFREGVNSEKPFSDDLQIIQDLIGNNPKLQEAVKKFAPYAKSGVLSTARLQGEFGRMGADIIEAGLSGDNVSLNQQITKHIGNLITVTKDGRTVLSSGNVVTEKVNKAHAQILKGDIGGAVRTLKTLEGPAAKEAKKWIRLAKGSLMAKKTNSLISQNLLSRISSGRQLSINSLETFLNRNFVQPLGLPKPDKMKMKWNPTSSNRDKINIEY